MMRILKYILVLVVLLFTTDTLLAQTTKWRDIHVVKKKETIFGIARDYGITIEELVKANPEMNKPGYELKKGDTLFIPYPKPDTQPAKAVASQLGKAGQSEVPASSTTNMIRLGVMLPLHDINGDGQRMVEYYRGILMACDSLKKQGLSVDVHAWNVAEDADITTFLQDKNAAKCDLIIGPLYSKQVHPLAEFVTAHDIKLLIPFSIDAPDLFHNRNIFQVYQNANDFNEAVIDRFLQKFSGYHPVFIDCNDSTSKKGIFTSGLRRRLEAQNISYSLTNLKSPEAQFAKAFSKTQPNVVILNTGRSPELNVAFAKIDGVSAVNPGLSISMFGYTEWLMYTRYQLDNFYKYDTYIPTTFYLNPLSAATDRINQKYRWNFHADMMQSLPRFAITGFDHACFFLKGMQRYGKRFTGTPAMAGYTPIQTPLRFERIGNGGLQNRSVLFVHYMPVHRIETINY